MNQTTIKTFKDFGIEVDTKAFSGDKINIFSILNQDVIIEDYKISPSKFEKKGDCLTMQIQYEGRQRVVFVTGTLLQEILRKIPKDGFPFRTQITKENGKYSFK